MDILQLDEGGIHGQDMLENLEGMVHEGQVEIDGGVDASNMEDKEQMGVLGLVYV